MIWAGAVALVGHVFLATTLAGSTSPPLANDEALVGIWGCETTFGPALSGELTIARSGSAWRATLGSAEVRFAVAGRGIRFAFPGSAGGFRGELTREGLEVEGFWLQPPGVMEDPSNPSGSGQFFASPLVLRRTRSGRWRGAVQPLEDRFTLYLKIFRGSDGSLLGAFRNPEMNSRGGAAEFRVSRDGDSVAFTARPDADRPEIRLTASLMGSPDRLRILWPDLNRTLDLTRRTSSRDAGPLPRPPGEAPYAYRKPPDTKDGWATARARDTGMDETALERLVRRLIGIDPFSPRPPLVHSLLVARRGKLVLEEYFFGFDGDRPHDLRSAGKTFASVMLGAAIARGIPLSPDTRVYDRLAGMGPFANPDPGKARITVAQLMTHTSGLACDDNDDGSPGNEGTMQTQRGQPDWWKYTLDLPIAHEPGSRYAYCSAGMNLVGAVLTASTRTWLPELFERTVARPLQFGAYHWNCTPSGEGYLGGGAYVRPRDLLKLGQAYLDGGVWKGRRLVEASWVSRSTSPQVEVTEATTSLEASRFQNFYLRGADGWAWHLSELRSGERTYRVYAANGNGGQFLIVIPALDLAVVFTAGNYGQGGIWLRFQNEIVPSEIIPAVRSEPAW